MENFTNQNKVVQNTASTGEQQANSKVKAKKPLPTWACIVIGAIFVIIFFNPFSGKSFGGNSMDDIVISCAKTVISQQLKSPSSAIWHNEKIVDKDSYGKYLIYLKVEATNSFGGYITNEYLVVVANVQKDGHFDYNTNFAVQSVTASTYDIVVDVIKELNSWNKKV